MGELPIPGQHSEWVVGGWGPMHRHLQTRPGPRWLLSRKCGRRWTRSRTSSSWNRGTLYQQHRLSLTFLTMDEKTSGSLASPACSAGLVAIKPTRGLTSQHGTYIVAASQDSTGVLAKTVLDAATVLSVIAGEKVPRASRISASQLILCRSRAIRRWDQH